MSRGKACRIFAARQEPKPKRRGKMEPTSCSKQWSWNRDCNLLRTNLGRTIGFSHQAQNGRRQLCQSSVRQSNTVTSRPFQMLYENEICSCTERHIRISRHVPTSDTHDLRRGSRATKSNFRISPHDLRRGSRFDGRGLAARAAKRDKIEKLEMSEFCRSSD